MSITADEAVPGVEAVPRGRSPGRIAFARLARNRSAMASLVVLVLIVISALAAPWYAEHVAHTDPFASNINGKTVVDGKEVDVVAPNPSGLGSTPIGPTLQGTTSSAPTGRAATWPRGSSTAAARR